MVDNMIEDSCFNCSGYMVLERMKAQDVDRN